MGNGARKAELIDFSQGQLDGNRPSIDWRLPWDSWRNPEEGSEDDCPSCVAQTTSVA